MEEVYNLGNVESGFDFDVISSLYRELDDFLGKGCYNCWAIRFCMKCFKDINRDGKLDEDVFQAHCRKSKTSILTEIKEYISIRENKSDALDYLDDITVI